MTSPANHSGVGRTIAGAVSAEPAVKGRPRVLVVKDDDGAGRAHLGAVRAKGFEVELVAHGEPVVAAVLARRHDAILLEQSASPERGWALLHLIRVYLARRDLPIVVLARTIDDPSAEQRWRTYDVARVFEKTGVSGAAVGDCLRKLLGLAAARSLQASRQEHYMVPKRSLTGLRAPLQLD